MFPNETRANASLAGGACLVCGNTRTLSSKDRHGFAHIRCRACGFVSLDRERLPKENVYTRDYFDGTLHERTAGQLGYPTSYAQELNGYRSRYHTRYADEIAALVSSHTLPKPRLLDFGCALGAFLKVLSARIPNAELHGVEVDPEICRRASANLGGASVYCIDVRTSEALPRDAFDVITLIDVVEHLDDPRAYLAALARSCRPGGYMLLSTPNIDSLNARIYGDAWVLHTPPYHTCYFGPKSLRHLLLETGLKVVSYFTERTVFHNERGGMETWRGRAARALFDNRPVDFLTNEVLKIGSTMTVIARKGT